MPRTPVGGWLLFAGVVACAAGDASDPPTGTDGPTATSGTTTTPGAPTTGVGPPGAIACADVETPPTLGGVTWYVSPTGQDDRDGRTEAEPLQTIAEAIRRAAPGDVVRLEPGAVFDEPVYLGPGDGGAPDAPLVISSSPTQPATVRVGAGSSAILLYNAAHVVVENLHLEGPGMTLSGAEGLAALADQGRYAQLTFRNLDISGFLEGLVVGSWASPDDGFDGVWIEDVNLHHNLQGGGSTYGLGTAAHRDVTVVCSTFAYNPGDPTVDRPSGDGFVLGAVTNGWIDGCVAHDNGGQGTNSAGPVGLWAYNSDAITIQYSESYGNRALLQDGDGFDLDVGVTRSVIQYCYAHDNWGAGFLFSQQGTLPWEDNVIRYNISEDDAVGAKMGALTFYSEASALGLTRGLAYGNTVYTSAGPALQLTSSPNASDNLVFNNLFVTDGGVPLVWDWTGDTDPRAVLATGNLYWAMDGAFDLQGRTTLDAWRDETGQERLDGAPTGWLADPRWVAPGTGSADGYQLEADSPAIDAGFDPADFGADPGVRDYFGQAVPTGAAFDLGAAEAD